VKHPSGSDSYKAYLNSAKNKSGITCGWDDAMGKQLPSFPVGGGGEGSQISPSVSD